MRWVSLRQYEMLEVDDAHSLRSDPAVRHGSDVVLGRHGLKDGDGEDHLLRLVCHHLGAMESNSIQFTFIAPPFTL